MSRAEAVGTGSGVVEQGSAATLTGSSATKVEGGYCLVQGMLDPHRSAEGEALGIGFELRLPDQWTDRFLYQGGGGMDGFIAPAVGGVPLRETSAPDALSRGFAVVSTDSGHTDKSGHGVDVSFATDQRARLDLGYRAIGRLTEVSKQILASFYGRPARYSYIMGCSNGGREALIAAQRFPEEFDGVVAGAPAYQVAVASLASAWSVQALTEIAPKDAGGAPILSKAFSDADLKLLSGSILDACDGKDGLKDGLIDDPKACRYDPAVLGCKAGKTEGCLSAGQVGALGKVFGALKDSHGGTIYPGWPYDAGAAVPQWRQWKLGSSPTGEPDALNATLMKVALAGFFLSPPEPGLDQLHLNFDQARARVEETHAMQDATWTQMSGFSAHGGKLLMFHGMSDPIFSATDTIGYYEKVARDNGGMSVSSQWARLFLVPGMTHCGGGPAMDDFDPLTAIIGWVEGGEVPARMVAKGEAFPGRTRPLCAYPKVARYAGSGSTEEARNFTCR